MAIVEQLHGEALKFMGKRVSVENNIKKDLSAIFILIRKEIERYIKSLPYVNLNYLNNIQNEIRTIIYKYLPDQNAIIENAISNSIESGINQANNFIVIAKIKTDPILQDDLKKSEALAVLMLYGKKLIENLNDDLINKLDKDLYSAYILSKNQNGSSINDKTRNTEDSDLLNTVLSGAVLSNYAGNTFDGINRRTDLISQTETNRALNTGIMLSFIFAKKQIANLKVKWVEVKDQRLCKYCKDRAESGLNGEGVYDIDSVSPPPIHPGCRCILIPYLEEWS